MPMNLLQLATEFCDRTGLDVPLRVVGATDAGVRQLRGLLNEVISDITNRGESWPLLQKQALFNTVAAELQGPLATIAPYGFKYIIPGTEYDRTERRPLWGPKGAGAWQESIALPVTGPLYSYRLWQGEFLIQPAPPAGHQIAFEYASDMAIQDVGGTYSKRFEADSDIFLLDEDLLLLGLRWKWKKEKGLSFVTEKLEYESALAQAMGNDGTKGEINMADNYSQTIRPGIFVPAGNWNV